jgi:hypothetical protein
VIRRGTDTITIQLERPAGEFGDGCIRCSPLAAERIGTSMVPLRSSAKWMECEDSSALGSFHRIVEVDTIEGADENLRTPFLQRHRASSSSSPGPLGSHSAQARG